MHHHIVCKYVNMYKNIFWTSIFVQFLSCIPGQENSWDFFYNFFEKMTYFSQIILMIIPSLVNHQMLEEWRSREVKECWSHIGSAWCRINRAPLPDKAAGVATSKAAGLQWELWLTALVKCWKGAPVSVSWDYICIKYTMFVFAISQ